jgi:hypothetical protein
MSNDAALLARFIITLIERDRRRRVSHDTDRERRYDLFETTSQEKAPRPRRSRRLRKADPAPAPRDAEPQS